MPLSVTLGLLLALATAFASILGFLYKQRGAAGAPPVTWRAPLRSTLALFSSRWWTLGLIVATVSWGLHVASLALAPITLVQSVIAGGLVLLTVLADRMFGLKVTQREWIAVAATAIGLAFLAATLGPAGSNAQNHYQTDTLAAYVGLLFAVSIALCVSVAHRPGSGGLALAVAAGTQWGVSDVTIKALSGHLAQDGIGVLISPLAVVIAAISLVGLVVSARSLQLGEAVPVIAITAAAGNLVTIASGFVVFDEPLGSGAGGTAARLLAFGLVIGAAALTPAPAARSPSASPRSP